MSERCETYITSATPVFVIDPVLVICVQVEKGDLDAEQAAREIAKLRRVEHTADRLADLAGFAGDETMIVIGKEG